MITWPLSLFQLVLWVHMAINPIQVLQVNTSNQATILEALSVNHEVKTGFVCSSQKDIVCVDGLCNRPSEHKYWTIEVNGDYEDFNSQSVVRPSDQVVLKYASSKER